MTIKNKKENCLPWNIVEMAIYEEIKWLKNSILTRADGSFFISNEERPSKCDNCNYPYRNIALLIIKGIIKARDINTQRGKDLWDGLTQTIVEHTKHRHGQDWHKRMMDVVDKFFESQGYEIITEPELNWGRADLGVYKKGKKNLFVEIGTTSIQKLWFNLSTMPESVFLIVPLENKAIEFET